MVGRRGGEDRGKEKNLGFGKQKKDDPFILFVRPDVRRSICPYVHSSISVSIRPSVSPSSVRRSMDVQFSFRPPELS